MNINTAGMNLFLLSLFLTTSLSLYSDNYFYSFQLLGVETAEDAKMAASLMSDIFDQPPGFDEVSRQFLVTSATNISEADFYHKVGDFGYTVEMFTKTEILEDD